MNKDLFKNPAWRFLVVLAILFSLLAIFFTLEEKELKIVLFMFSGIAAILALGLLLIKHEA